MGDSRRHFLQSLAGAGALAAPAALRANHSPTQTPTLSAPLTHSDWALKPNVSAGLDGLRYMLDACRQCGWLHVYWRVFDAGQATYASRLLKPASQPEADNCFRPKSEEDVQLWNRYFPSLTRERASQVLARLAAINYGQFDSLAAAIEYGHSIGLKIYAWATINEDDHGWGWPSEFSKSHPEFRWVRRNGSCYRSQLSFAFPEVRAYKLTLLEELLAYDIDGLLLDWIRTGDVRDNPQTDPDGVADSGYEVPNVESFRRRYALDPHAVPNGDVRWVKIRAVPQTIFMREVRKLIDSRGAGRLPVSVLVGHPWHYRGLLDPIDGNLRGLLLDVKTWAEEGLIDSAVAAGYYRPGGSAATAYHALAEETGGKVELWYYAWVPQDVSEFQSQLAEAKSLGAGRILFWEADYIDDRAEADLLKAAMKAHSS